MSSLCMLEQSFFHLDPMPVLLGVQNNFVLARGATHTGSSSIGN